MKKTFLVLLLMGVSAAAISQQPDPVSRFYIKIEYHDLYSTHRDHFRGVSVTVSKPVSPMLRLGVGTEFSGNNYHPDNDWKLYHLRFLPLFVDQQLKPKRGSWLYPVLHFSEGWSYVAYQKETLAGPGVRRPVHETGLYLYGGAGLTGNLSERISLSAEAGIKGFHNSFNDLDVNPHGFTGRLALLYRGAAKQ